jgi:hypothetical protein
MEWRSPRRCALSGFGEGIPVYSAAVANVDAPCQSERACKVYGVCKEEAETKEGVERGEEAERVKKRRRGSDGQHPAFKTFPHNPAIDKIFFFVPGIFFLPWRGGQGGM